MIEVVLMLLGCISAFSPNIFFFDCYLTRYYAYSISYSLFFNLFFFALNYSLLENLLVKLYYSLITFKNKRGIFISLCMMEFYFV